MPSHPDEARALRTGNLDEAIEAVARIYCPHTVEAVGRARGIDAPHFSRLSACSTARRSRSTRKTCRACF
jgi:hypothetical protein